MAKNERSFYSGLVSKGEATKVSILDEALHVASQVGFEGLSIGQLAERTEMSKSGLFAHFRSKEQLQLQTLDHAVARFTDIVVRPTLRAPRGERRVRELFERWLDWESEALAGGCVFATAAIEYDDQPGVMHDSLVRQQRDWTELIATVAGTAVSEGEFRTDLDTRQFAFSLQSLMFGYRHAGRLLRDPDALARTRAAFEQLLASSR
jgi:AcrR family transcriptional regulator